MADPDDGRGTAITSTAAYSGGSTSTPSARTTSGLETS